MERIVSKILNNSEQIREECGAIQKVLFSILDKDKEAIKDVKNLNDKDISFNKKYLLGLLEYQYLAIKKLTEIYMELDEFSKEPQTLNLDVLLCKSELSLTPSSACTCDIPSKPATPSHKDNTPILQNILDEKQDAHVSKSKFELSIVKLPSCSYEVTTSTGTPITSTDESKPITISSDNLSKPGNTLLDRKPEKPSKVSSESSTESDKSEGKKSSADISSSEEISRATDTKTKSIQEKLKCKKLMTRRDRHLQNIERPEVPDLSFKPSRKTIDNENYITCVESSSSASNSKLIERRRKKRRSPEHDTAARGTADYKRPPEPFLNMSCLISHVVNPSEFYICRFDDDILTIDTLSYQLGELYKDTQSPYQDKNHALNMLGNNCVCYVPDFENWYRVIVTNWRLNARDYQEDCVTVFLIDYGHTCDIGYKNLRELSEAFCKLPRFAIKCHLAWLYPFGSTKENLLETWSKQTLEYFRNIFLESDKNTYKVLYVEKYGKSWGIDLIKEGDEDKPTYGQMLIDNGLAVEIFQDAATLFKNDFFRKQITTAQGLAGISSAMDNGEKIEKFHENTGENEHSSIHHAMLEYKARDEARICKNARPDGTCFKGKRCKLDHGKLRSDGYTTDKQCIFVSAFAELRLPEVDTTVKLQITYVTSVNTFYACFINSQSGDFRNLIGAMNQRDSILKYKPLEIIPARGELVIAKSWNGFWYRAQVKDSYHYRQNAEETVQVFLVDFGEIVDTKMSDLRIMDPEYLHLPFQAVSCRLYNVKPKENDTKYEAKCYFEEHFLCQIFTAEIKHVSFSILEILLKRDNNEDVGEQIIEEGYGELQTDHIYPSETLLVD